MAAVFKGRHRDRLIVETADGFIIANAVDDCDFEAGETISGVRRDHGTQYWNGSADSGVEVYVEGFDVTASAALSWLHA